VPGDEALVRNPPGAVAEGVTGAVTRWRHHGRCRRGRYGWRSRAGRERADGPGPSRRDRPLCLYRRGHHRNRERPGEGTGRPHGGTLVLRVDPLSGCRARGRRGSVGEGQGRGGRGDCVGRLRPDRTDAKHEDRASACRPSQRTAKILNQCFQPPFPSLVRRSVSMVFRDGECRYSSNRDVTDRGPPYTTGGTPVKSGPRP
jgi:hypothetical protein